MKKKEKKRISISVYWVSSFFNYLGNTFEHRSCVQNWESQFSL